MHKPILRRVGLVLVLVSLLQLAWAIYVSTFTHKLSFDITFLVGGIALMFGRLSTARFIRRVTAIGLVAAAVACAVLVGFVGYWLATEPISSAIAELRSVTVEKPMDLATAFLCVTLFAWIFRELGRPEVLTDGYIPPEQRPTSTGSQARCRRARADPGSTGYRSHGGAPSR